MILEPEHPWRAAVRMCGDCEAKGSPTGFIRSGEPSDPDFYRCSNCIEDRDRVRVASVSSSILNQVFPEEI